MRGDRIGRRSADDTGLEVDALDGRPGVHTAGTPASRRNDADNRAQAARRARRAIDDRRAHFRTVAMVVLARRQRAGGRGSCARASIATAERGSDGFGYDSLFVPDDGDGRTFAEMTDDEKHAISHRGRAFAALVEALRAS